MTAQLKWIDGSQARGLGASAPDLPPHADPPLSRRAVRHFDLQLGAGVRAMEREAGGPAALAGLEAGDVIVQFSGEWVTGID